MKKKNITAIGIALMILLITAGCGSNKNSDNESGVTDEAAIVLSNEESTENTLENDGVVFHSYDEFIEKINYLLDVMDTSDSETFLDEATRYLWVTSPVYNAFTNQNDQFGYLQVDIDGDGVDELLLGTTGSEDDSYYVDIISMFTLRKGVVYTVFERNERDCYTIYAEGIIEHSFVYPNSSYGAEYFKYNAGNLEAIESAYCEVSFRDDEWGEVYYYSDSASQERELTEKEYHELSDVLKNRYCKQEMQLQLHLFKDKQ